MRKEYSRLQISSVLRSFFIVLMILTVLYVTVVYVAFRSFIVSQLILVINLILSAVGGWYLYKSRYHMEFYFDDKGFTLQIGSKERATQQWSDFANVSLVRVEYGEFAVRLYYAQGRGFIDIPVSRLKLDPSEFRFEAMKFVGIHSAGEKG